VGECSSQSDLNVSLYTPSDDLVAPRTKRGANQVNGLNGKVEFWKSRKKEKRKKKGGIDDLVEGGVTN
jgi:hypothetical protein